MAHNLEEKPRTKDVILNENVNFTSLLLPDNILKGLDKGGFRKPSPIQFKAVPLGRCGFDLIIKSKSGTGKTLVFSTVALESVNVTKNHLQAIILVPTREIAVQIEGVLKNIGSFIEGLHVRSFIGGLPLEDDLKKSKQCHIAVGAPGRVKHLISLKALPTKHVRLFVLDEADKLLEDSFKSDINEIYHSLPHRKQVIACSATYPQELDTFLMNYMSSPTHVSSEIETPVLLGLKQFVSVIECSPNVVQLMKSKNETLIGILSKVLFTQCLVFTNYQTRAESISNYLNQNNWDSTYISAAQSQIKRLEAVNNLKDFKNRILLSTDLTSRGIDAPNVDLVINYDIPQDAVTYLHRMGRAGRYGSPGICINLARNGEELKHLQHILGTIGASNLSISKLPPLNEDFDLWKMNASQFEQISGVVLEKTEIEGIKNEILSIKQHGFKKKSELTEINDCNDDSFVNLLNDIKKNDMEDTFPSLDNQDLLQSLLKNCNDDNTKKSELLKTDSEIDERKRKRDSVNEIGQTLHKEKRKNEITNPTFVKNKALLSITKILCNPELQIDSDLVDSVSHYRTNIKENESEDNLPPDLNNLKLNETEQCSKSERSVESLNDTGKDIFAIGYECAIGEGDKSWLHCIPKEEYERFQKSCMQQSVSSESEDDEDYEEADGMEQDELGNEPNAIHSTGLEWVPVVHNSNTRDNHEVNYNEQFSRCYQECNDVLLQNGLNFESVEQFDNWFSQWQEQLLSVRNYVQQNIYVSEMSKYQQNRDSK